MVVFAAVGVAGKFSVTLSWILLLIAFLLIVGKVTRVARERTGRWVSVHAVVVTLVSLMVLGGLGLWVKPIRASAQPDISTKGKRAAPIHSQKAAPQSPQKKNRHQIALSGKRPNSTLKMTPKRQPTSMVAKNQPAVARSSPSGSITQNNVNGNNVVNSGSGTVNVNSDPNPYANVVYYDFNGGIRETANSGTVSAGEEFVSFQDVLYPLHEAKKWKALAEACEKDIKAYPQWLTPYQWAGEAYKELGEKNKAVNRLGHVVKIAGPNSTYADSAQMLQELEGKDKPK